MMCVSGPPEDRELELREHIEELRKRLIRICIILIAAVSISYYVSYPYLLSFWYSLVGENPIYVFTPLEWVVIRLAFSVVTSLLLLYPYVIYELYLFAKPGLYEHERKFLKAILIPSYGIFLFGTFIAYKFVIPVLYSIALSGAADPYLSAERTITNALKLLIYFGFFFQIPLFMVLSDRFGIINYSTYKGLRIPAYIFILLFITNLTMDFTGLTQIAALVLFIIMYETGLVMLRILSRKAASRV
uniref:Twin-arginine translocase subunit TatC n=1 Tax=Archaeoglobus fulgidus TaxID=2234 RepID=A0A7C3ZEC7_ARCFL